jgi:predicted 3-demethylubiquinone-9 3-methyltransferase (glyoxalase superfamily)
MQEITPCLWFKDNAEEAAHFYLSVFKNSKILITTHYGDDMPLPKGTVLTVVFELNGAKFVALNGGPQFTFTPAVSFVVNCRTQAEIDEMWEKLSEGGKKGECGWLTDKYGLSWQVVPEQLETLISKADAAALNRMMAAIMQMHKFDLGRLEEAYQHH